MKSNLVLLLTQDIILEEQAAQAGQESGAPLIISRNIGDALQVVCRHVRDIILIVIDFDNGSRGMTLLTALNMLRDNPPIVVVTSTDADRTAAFAYANGGAACLAKPINATELEIMIRAFARPKPELMAA